MAVAGIALSLLSMSLSLTSAAPLTPLETELQAAQGNKTLLNTEIAPSWATTSNVRATSDLLWTCVLTLFVCVFTVIHVNIPPPNESHFAHYFRKTKWAVTAILAPELALAAALQQWNTARALKLELNSLAGKQSDGKANTESSKKFGMTYCFYAVMGGFVVDVSEIHNTHSLLTLQPRGIVDLAEKGHFLEMSEKSINDKSKADILAKLLVCVQVVWMVLQCIGRRAQSLPISLLEIHVLVHVACALSMYALWIEKPFDVLDPTIIDATRFPNELALMLIGSSCSGDTKDGLRLYAPYAGSLNSDAQTALDDEGVRTVEFDRRSVPIITHENPEDATGRLLYSRWETRGIGHYITLRPSQSLPSGLGIRHKGDKRELSAKDLERWTRATVSMRQDQDKYASNMDLKLPKDWLRSRSLNFGNTAFNFNAKHFRDGSIDGLDDDPMTWVMVLALPLVYGSVHLAAWNFEFPTHVEKIMWKVACVLVAGGIPGLALTFFLRGIVEKLGTWVLSRFSRLHGLFSGVVEFCSAVLTGVIATLYFGARVFIIIESFISVRKLPLGVYITVDWADYIPHL